MYYISVMHNTLQESVKVIRDCKIFSILNIYKCTN